MTHLDGDGKFGESFEAMRRHLRYSKSRRSLVGAINDPSALGALRAFQEAGRTDSCAIVGHNASPEGRAELREPGTRLVGSVAYFPEKYGAEIVAVALDILHRKAVPPAVFVKHQLVTPETVNHIYPNDELMIAGNLRVAMTSETRHVQPDIDRRDVPSACAAALTAQQKPDYSGEYVLNPQAATL